MGRNRRTKLKKTGSLTSLLALLSKSYFLTISLVVHLALVLLFGSVALFEHATEPPDFAAGEGASFVQDTGGGGGGGFFGSHGIRKTGSIIGIMYDLKQTKDGKDSGMDDKKYGQIVERFAHDNFRESDLAGFYRFPKPLYTTRIMIPNMRADEGPKAFGAEQQIKPCRWLVHCRVSPPKSGTYHFVGAGDDMLLVKFNGRLVLNRCWYVLTGWKAQKNYDYGTRFPNGFAKGDAMQIIAGQWYDLDALIGEQPGRFLNVTLLIKEEGTSYARDVRSNPILPDFQFTDEALPVLKKGQTYPPYAKDGPTWKAQAGTASGAAALDLFKQQTPSTL